MLGSDEIPPEIWLQIASYMDIADIQHAETSNRTFAALVAENQRAQRSRLIINISDVNQLEGDQVTYGDWTAIARNALERLQVCMYACLLPYNHPAILRLIAPFSRINRAPQSKQVAIYSYPVPEHY